MSNKLDITVKEVEYVKRSGLTAGRLILELSGKNMNIKMVNAIRRICTNNIPAYAFPPELIKIENNTCVAFNNDYMKLRLSQLPVFDIDPDIVTLHERYWKSVNYADPKREKHPNEKNIEVYINSHNNSDSIQSVTTNDIKFYLDGEQINPYNTDFPILIIKLRPNDSFKCHMKAVLGIGDRHTIWSSASNSFYDEEKSGVYKLTLESCGQYDEFILISRACKYIMKRTELIKAELERRVVSKEIPNQDVIYFYLVDDDHSMGELINYDFQEHKDIAYSGISKPDHLIKAILIKVQSFKGIKSPMNAIYECLDNITNRYKYLDKLIIELRKRYYK